MRVSDRVLGWYHIGGAVAGGVLTFWGWTRGAALPGNTIATAAIPFALSWAAGVALLQGRPRARHLAVLTQVLQIPIVVLPSITWKFIAGVIASITVSAQGTGVYVGLEATWLVGTGPANELPITVGLNFAPVVVIILLSRSRSAIVPAVPESAP